MLTRLCRTASTTHVAIDDSTGSTHTRVRWSALLAAGIIVSLLAGCDGFGGVEQGEAPETGPGHDERAHARNALELTPGSFSEADLHFKPVAVAPGESFTMSMVGTDDERALAQVVHRNRDDGDLALSARFESFDTQTVVVRYRIQNTVMRRDTLSGISLEDGVPVGKSSKEPTSWHYKEVGDQVVVVVDYDNDDSKSTETATEGDARGALRTTTIDPAYSASAVECTHVAFVVPGPASSAEPKGVKMHGAAEEVSFVKKRFETR